MNSPPIKSAWKIAMFLLESLLLIDSTATSDSQAEETSIPYLLWMCHEIINHKNQWKTDKAHRWVGYIQGVMVAKGWSNVAIERDRVRKIV